MIIQNKKSLIFPEYYLTNFPSQFDCSFSDALDLVHSYKRFGFDYIVAGDVERDGNYSFSSCVVLDSSQHYNIQKRNPDESEKGFITPGELHEPLDLTIGVSYFLICRDMIVESQNNRLRDILKSYKVDNLFFISAMFKNFDHTISMGKELLKKKQITRFITSDRFNGCKLFE